MNKTEKIFKVTSPYAHAYQGNATRLLFVCSAGLLRSPTAASVAAKQGYNVRCCGSNPRYALVDLSVNLIMWADHVVFVNVDNYNEAMHNFRETDAYEKLKQKSIIWDIPDIYDYGDKMLVRILDGALQNEDIPVEQDRDAQTD